MTEALPVDEWTVSRVASPPRVASGHFGSGQWEILERIARGASLSDLLLNIVALVERQAEGMLCSILIFDPVAGVLRHGAARRLAPELCQALDGIRVGPSATACGMAAFRRQRVVVTDLATHPAWAAHKEPFLAHGLRACWSTPILSPAGELLGTLAMYFSEARGPNQEECAWVDGATHLAAIALSRARAERENDRLLHALGDRVRELTLLHKSARLLQSHGIPLAERLEALVAMIPSGWRYPEQCRARITSQGLDVCTAGFRASPFSQVALAPAGESSVRLEVVYLEDMRGGRESPFLPEERTLLESLADLLGAHLEKHHGESSLRSALSALRDKNQRLEFHANNMPLGYVVWDRERTVTEWRGAAERIFGVSAPDVLGKRSTELMLFDPTERALDALGAELTASVGGGRRGTHAHLHKDGTRIICEWLHTPLVDDAGQVVGYVSMAHDVTERIRAEEERLRLETQLRQAQRIQSLGTLAGGIAHDFNNILTAISGHAHLGLCDLEEERSPEESLHAIQEASVRAVELVRRILTFSRRQEPMRKSCALAPIVEEAASLLRGTLSAGVTLETRIDPATPAAYVDAAQIRQVIINLGANAAYAIVGAGSIQIAVDSIECGQGGHCELSGIADTRPGRYVRITVTDTGAGMDESVLEHIFEPFFSTKPSGQGTGLGLSVVHGIVKSHDGTVTVQSKPGKGTVFRVYLPDAPAKASARVAAPAPAVSAAPHGARVLYVDDEEPLVALATRWLGRLGYQVTGMSDSMQALETFRARPHDFDAVISDISMPGLTGLELIKEVRAIRDDVIVVMSSGYLKDEDRQRAKELGAVDLVLKPQSMAEFGRILHGILSERERARGAGPSSAPSAAGNDRPR